MNKLNEKGVGHILVLLAAVGLIAFLFISSTAFFKDNFFAALYPKPDSYASGPIGGTGFGNAVQLAPGASQSQYITVSNSTNIHPTANFTIEGWLKPNLPTASTSVYGSIFSKTRSSLNDNSFNLSYSAYLESDGKVRYKYVFTVVGKRAGETNCLGPNLHSDSGTVPGDTQAPVSAQKAGSWRHIAAVVKDGVLSLYEDGRLLNTRPDWVLTQFCTSTSPITIGSGFYADGIAFPNLPTLVDEVRISNTARYSSNFAAPTAPFVADSNTLALFHFDNNTSDATAFGNHGNIFGSIQYINSTIGSPNSTQPPATSVPTPIPTVAPTSVPTIAPTPLPAKRVFVTSQVYQANLGGVSGANAKCQASADSSNLGGNWKAWISGLQTPQILTPLGTFTKHNGPYKLINGTVVANNWTDLTDGTLASPINITEKNASTTKLVWTNTGTNGDRLIKAGSVCGNTAGDWTGTNSLTSAPVGNPQSATSSWSSSGGTGTCNVYLSLYCFEQ